VTLLMPLAAVYRARQGAAHSTASLVNRPVGVRMKSLDHHRAVLTHNGNDAAFLINSAATRVYIRQTRRDARYGIQKRTQGGIDPCVDMLLQSIAHGKAKGSHIYDHGISPIKDSHPASAGWTGQNKCLPNAKL
jgi:hypothetical protein